MIQLTVAFNIDQAYLIAPTITEAKEFKGKLIKREAAAYEPHVTVLTFQFPAPEDACYCAIKLLRNKLSVRMYPVFE